jgi:predicted metal-dependent hydrolase
MTTIKLGQQLLSYSVKYSKKRKTGQLKIISAHSLEITVPYNTSESYIQNLLQNKTSWILKKTSALAKIDLNPINKSLCDGALILYLGRPHTLSLQPFKVKHPVIHLHEKQITIQFPEQIDTRSVLLKYALKDWYIENAKEILHTKTLTWSDKIGVTPKNIHIKEQKTRWGSCSSLGTINYNWRIVMSPLEIIDYLVVHELCHLKFLDHSPLFWGLVSQYLPDYKQRRIWLRNNGKLLSGVF